MALGLLVSLVVGVAIAQGAKEVGNFIGASSSGSQGGEFNTSRGVAVNETGAGASDAGDIYVVEQANHRIQRFDSDRNFISAWGADVSQPSGGNDFEICTVAADCKQGVASGGNTTAAGNGVFDSPQEVAVDQDTGIVYVSDRGNRRINAYEGDGTFLFSVGRDVQEPDGDAVTEICGDVGGDICRQGDGGNDAGNVGATTTSGVQGIAVSPPDGNAATGTLFLADSQNRRVNTYDLDGTNPASFGSSSNFGTTQPRKIAVDSRGIVYASDSNNGGEIDRYDSEDANGGGVSFLSSIAVPPLLTGSTATATGGLAVDPDGDGVGPDEDVLYVLRDPSSGPTVVQQYGPTNAPGLTAAPTATDDEHGAGAGFQVVNGLAADSSSGQLFVSTNSTTAAGSGHRVFVLDDLAAPGVTIDPVASGMITATGAELAGTVDANGALTRHRFEYRVQGETEWTLLPVEDSGSDDDPVAVMRTVEGLQPNTDYEVRLSAFNAFASGSATSSVETFTTEPDAPYVGLTDAEATHETAILSGRVTANNQSTSYYFEWGTSDSYGNSAPVSEDADAGSGGSSTLVSEEISGLGPATTYHFRLVATNATGTTEGPGQTFETATEPSQGCPNEEYRQGKSAQLPHCRVYEQVSPVDKNGHDVLADLTDLNYGAGPVAVRGGATIFRSFGAFAGHPVGGAPTAPGNLYLSQRSDDDWATVPAISRPTPTRGVRSLFATTPDLRHSLLRLGGSFGSDSTPASGFALYRRDNLSGTNQLLADTATDPRLIASSTDLERTIVSSTESLTPDAPAGQRNVYSISGSGIELISRQPLTNDPFTGDSGLAGANTAGGLGGLSDGAISADGSRAFFANPVSGSGVPSSNQAKIYRRSAGLTKMASPSHRTPADPAGERAKKFVAASDDGGRLLFTSVERLTNDANDPAQFSEGDLYRYDIEDDELINLSQGTVGSADANVEGLLGTSESLNRVYFVATGQVVPGEGVQGEPNLFLWEDDGTRGGRTEYIATLSQGGLVAPRDELNWRSTGDKTARVTPDGRYLLFRSDQDLAGSSISGTTQVFHFDADADGGEGKLVCVSCSPSGDPSIGSAGMPSTSTYDMRALTNVLSEDGQTAFFESNEDLVPRDVNGQRDVYVWRSGELDLISSGTSSDFSRFFGASIDGQEVFFITRDQLVPQDIDGLFDVYVAKVGGGLTSQHQKPAPSCEGDACQGEDAPPLGAGDPGSGDFEGPGNLKPGHKAQSCEQLEQRLKRTTPRLKRANRAAKTAGRTARQATSKAKRASGPKADRLSRKAKRMSRKAAKKKRQLKKARVSRRSAERDLRRCQRRAEQVVSDRSTR